MSNRSLLAACIATSGVLAAATRPAPREVVITAMDYAYRAPASVPAGETVVRFVNTGKHLHELQFFRFKPGITVRQANAYLATGEVPDSAYDIGEGVLIAIAGHEARERVLVDLQRGDLYALMCQFRDTTNAPMHSKMGMVGLLQVK